MILIKGKGIKRREVRRALSSSASSTQPELRTALSLPRSYSCATMLCTSLLRADYSTGEVSDRMGGLTLANPLLASCR